MKKEERVFFSLARLRHAGGQQGIFRLFAVQDGNGGSSVFASVGPAVWTGVGSGAQ